jgi:hypothetical protein
MQATSQTPSVTSGEMSYNRLISEGNWGPQARPECCNVPIVIVL